MSDIGIKRLVGGVPTDDSASRGVLSSTGRRTPTETSFLGHTCMVDMLTGNLTILCLDFQYPFYGLGFSVGRAYDLQEAFMQASYMRDYPNVDPKPHWFGNWASDHEAVVNEIFEGTKSELQVGAGTSLRASFDAVAPDFRCDTLDRKAVEEILRTYGVPKRLTDALAWNHCAHDFLLRTSCGAFHVATGRFFPKTVVDEMAGDLWVFDPVNSLGFHLTSQSCYDVQRNGEREVGSGLLVRVRSDGLGHGVGLVTEGLEPPYDKFTQKDSAGRRILFERGYRLPYEDGRNRGSRAWVRLVSTVIDSTKTAHNAYVYVYDAVGRLIRVTYPSTAGSRFVRYHYEGPYPGALTAIEDPNGNRLEFAYFEDGEDNEARLRPRLKVRQIRDATGNVFDYAYHARKQKCSVSVSRSGWKDCEVGNSYIQDRGNTEGRFVSESVTEVRRGFALQGTEVVPLQNVGGQTLRLRFKYSDDGRFNLIEERGPLDRWRAFRYNEFNQVVREEDFSGRATEATFDLPAHPGPQNPRRYDLMARDTVNVIRTRQAGPSPTYSKEVVKVIEQYNYRRYDSSSSPTAVDRAFSTHRLAQYTDPRGKTWKQSFDDVGSHCPLEPTETVTPLGFRTRACYGAIGERVWLKDAEGNEYRYTYTPQGQLEVYQDPNGAISRWTYYPCSGLLRQRIDEVGGTTSHERDALGRVIRVVDPCGDSTEYRYSSNGEVSAIVQRRPAVRLDPAKASSPAMTSEYAELITAIEYTPLGAMVRLTNPGGQLLSYEYDEAGRMTGWHHSGAPHSRWRFVYDEASQLVARAAPGGGVTRQRYSSNGFLAWVQYPDWHDGEKPVAGKKVEYLEYDIFGRPFTVRDSELPAKSEMTYDISGMISTRTDNSGNSFSYEYDEDSRLTKVADQTGVYEMSLALDELGRTKRLTDAALNGGSVSWDHVYSVSSPNRRVLHLFRRYAPAPDLLTLYDYDERSRLTLCRHMAFPGKHDEQIVLQGGYTYRSDDLITKVTSTRDDSFRYDALKQLIREEHADIWMDYDRVGNRLFRRAAGDVVAESQFQGPNQLTYAQETGAQFVYDSCGNLSDEQTRKYHRRYFFDGGQRLRRIVDGSLDIQYLYDVDGRLVQQLTKDGSKEEKVALVYEAGRAVMLKRNGALWKVLTRDPKGDALRIRELTTQGNTQTWITVFPLHDGRGHILKVMSDDGKLVFARTMDPWGKIESCTGNKIALRFIDDAYGLRDDWTGLALMGARWYSPDLGRWISQDALPHQLIFSCQEKGLLQLFPWRPEEVSEEAGLFYSEVFGHQLSFRQLTNLYFYAENCPTTLSDPSGFVALWAIATAGILLVAIVAPIEVKFVESIFAALGSDDEARKPEEGHPERRPGSFLMPNIEPTPIPPWERSQNKTERGNKIGETGNWVDPRNTRRGSIIRPQRGTQPRGR